mmetsp:Transcript_26892/g.57652  ORF Transcript_26892/g.57652 Transcript_26892/m.57652 type:complete len:1336 (+) Transcript_26892:116-4123(+)
MAPIPLPDWIRRARCSISKQEYLDCAVAVALDLTNRLCIVVGTSSSACPQFNASFNNSLSAWDESFSIDVDPSTLFDEGKETCGEVPSSSLLLIQIEDIVPENVIISLANNDSHVVSSANFMATEVNIQPADSKARDMFEAPQLLQRDLCFALGKILFELFSQGDPLFLIGLGSNDDNEEQFDGLDIDQIISNDKPAPALKKSSLSNTSTSNISQVKSMKAKVFLQEEGLPLPICQLVSDLLEAEVGNAYISNTALLSLDVAQFDLKQMKTQPQRFLHSPTCPRKVLENTSLFNQMDGELYGREKEMNILMETAARVHLHAPPPSGCTNGGQQQGVIQVNDFLCEAVFLTGYPGSGKSSLIKQLVSFCNANDWFELICNFDRQVSPLSALFESFDSFFAIFLPIQGVDGRPCREPSAQEAFDRISQSIISSIDMESFSQLCELLPNLSKQFPMAMGYVQRSTCSPPLCGVGSGSNRLKLLLQIIFKAVCSGGHPVAIILEDLQWSDALTQEIIGDLVQTAGYSSAFSAGEESPQGGLLLLGSFRENEINEDEFLMKQMKSMGEFNKNINVNRLSVGELPEHEINKMLSFKFCLPIRHTRELAQLVHQKTRGNSLYILEFLRSIIQNNMMTFSVKSRRWTWDDTSIDLHMISEGVVGLLTKKLMQLPYDVIETLKAVSCFGCQINVSTIELLDLGQFVPDMPKALGLAVKEGILNKAGPLFAFSHDLLRETTYSLIPIDERKLLHKKIGLSVVQDPEVADNAELCTLFVDQINICKDVDGILSPVERAFFARLNLAAGKHSIAASSYEQARGYFEAGISLLHTNPWDIQYDLCLELYEMSVVVSFMDGKVETVSSRLDVIFSNAKSFDDALNSRALSAKFLASQEQHAEAVHGVLDILLHLGEEFPKEVCLSHVIGEVKATQRFLKDITKEKILNLPTMQDVEKLNAMKFMGLLIILGNFISPMLVHLVCCRMMKLTFEFGFCEDTISGLAFASHALLHYSDDIQLASRIGRIAESLISGNLNEHSLRARLTQMSCSAKVFGEPFQATADFCLKGYNSANIVGDVDNAMLCSMLYCIAFFFSISDAVGLQRNMISFMQQMTKHKRINVLHSLMSYYDAVTALIGNGDSCSIDSRIEIKSNKELYHIANQTQNNYLMHHVIINQMYVHCYFKEYLAVANLGEKYRTHTEMNNGAKRVLDFYQIFLEGIAVLCLARDTKEEKWRKIGEEAVNTMAQLVECSTWNFENKRSLLQAELHYLNDRPTMAELSYQAAIVSAREHKFYHEEALACELYGIYLVENGNVLKGLDQLQLAIDKYKQWGATKKVDDVKNFVEACQF